MAQFDYDRYVVRTKAESLEEGTGDIPVDGSYEREYMYIVNTTATPSAGTGPDSTTPNYNGREFFFDFQPPVTCRAVLSRCYMEVTGIAKIVGTANGAEAAWAPKYTYSIPWCYPAAVVEVCEYQLNGISNAVEKYTVRFADACQAKYLTRYSGPMLEAMDNELMTPCIESRRDMSNMVDGGDAAGRYEDATCGLSPESNTRANRWLRSQVAAANWRGKQHVKVIPLHALFDSCSTIAAIPLQRFVMKIRFRQPGDIMFRSNTDATPGFNAVTGRYYITGVRLFMCYSVLSKDALDDEIARIKQEACLFRSSFLYYTVMDCLYSPGGTLPCPGMKNVQYAAVFFSSVECADGQYGKTTNPGILVAAHQVGVNPLQYNYNVAASADGDLASPNNGINSYVGIYLGRNSPDTPARLVASERVADNTNKIGPMENTEIYQQYLVVTGRYGSRHLPPALTLSHFGSPESGRLATAEYGSTELTPYAGFYSYFFPLMDAHAHDSMLGGQLDFRLAGGSKTMNARVVVARLGFMSIMADGSVQVIN